MIIVINADCYNCRAHFVWLFQTAVYEYYWRTSNGHQILHKIWYSIWIDDCTVVWRVNLPTSLWFGIVGHCWHVLYLLFTKHFMLPLTSILCSMIIQESDWCAYVLLYPEVLQLMYMREKTHCLFIFVMLLSPSLKQTLSQGGQGSLLKPISLKYMFHYHAYVTWLTFFYHQLDAQNFVHQVGDKKVILRCAVNQSSRSPDYLSLWSGNGKSFETWL